MIGARIISSRRDEEGTTLLDGEVTYYGGTVKLILGLPIVTLIGPDLSGVVQNNSFTFELS